jgi:hypothetical protein
MSHGIALNALDRPQGQAKTLLCLWAMYPVVLPFYFMGRTLNPGTQKLLSGVPQVADYYFIAVMVLVFLNLPFRLPRAVVPVVGALAAFVSYTALVNALWAAKLEDLSLLKNTFFYFYDLLLFVTCMLLYERFKDEFLKVTVYAVAASVLLQVLLSPLAIEPGQARQALFFNDENQLGYFCVLAATIFTLGARRFAIRPWYQAAVYTAIGYLAFISECRGALVALGILLFLAVLELPVRLLLVIGGLVAVYGVVTVEPAILGKSAQRLVVTGEYDTAETRGYDRIVNYPEYILCGAGEGAYERFRSALFGSELHSSFGTLLFCYGIMGTVLFSAALVWLARADLRSALFLIPAFAYGFAHQGVRAAFFWMMLAVLAVIALCPPRAAATIEETA